MNYQEGELRKFKDKLTLSRAVAVNSDLTERRRMVKGGEYFIVLENVEDTQKWCAKVLLIDGTGYLSVIGLAAESVRLG